jgi:hypothetical protein
MDEHPNLVVALLVAALILALKLGMVVLGLLAVVMGKFDWGLQKPLRGPAVRIAGGVLMLPLPLALLLGVVWSLLGRTQARQSDPSRLQAWHALAEALLFVTCAGAAAAILFFFARSPARPRRRGRKAARRRTAHDEPVSAVPADEEFPEGPRAEFTPISSTGGRWVVGGMVVGALLIVVLCAGAGVWASILRERVQDGAGGAPAPPAKRAAPARLPHRQS